MSFLSSRVPSFRSGLVKAIFASLFFIIGGLSMSLWQTIIEMKEDANVRLLHARTMLDNALDSAYQGAIAAKDTLDKPCDQVSGMLDKLALAPDIRSISLVQGDTVYCNSFFGTIRVRTDINSYTGGRLKLMNGDLVTPDKPFIILREPVGKNSILVLLDGHYPLYILQMLSDNSPLSLAVGQYQWSHAQPFADKPYPSASPNHIEVASTRYPFRIITQYSNEQYVTGLWQHGKVSVICFLVLGILLGWLMFRLTTRTSSPLREMELALSQQEFIPFIQPVVSGTDGSLTGCEVLMRWQHPELGMIPPDRFIPMAEASGLIIPMTRLLMAQVREQFAPLVQQLPQGFHFGINISACHCRDMGLVQDCREFIEVFNDNPIKLVLELTERELLIADEVSDRLFAELRELGVFIGIDDFGTGHSSLTYLQQFRVDFLKIDQSFVGMIGSDALSGHIVDSVIDLATRLDLMTVAEGVETEAQAAYLRDRKVDFQQGYFHGRPMPMTEFAKLLVS